MGLELVHLAHSGTTAGGPVTRTSAMGILSGPQGKQIPAETCWVRRADTLGQCPVQDPQWGLQMTGLSPGMWIMYVSRVPWGAPPRNWACPQETGPAWTTGAGTKSQGCCRIHSGDGDGQACPQSHRHTCLLLGPGWAGLTIVLFSEMEPEHKARQDLQGPNRYPCLRKPERLVSHPDTAVETGPGEVPWAAQATQLQREVSELTSRGSQADMSPLRSLGGQDCSQNIIGQGWTTGLPQTLQSGWSQCAYLCCQIIAAVGKHV